MKNYIAFVIVILVFISCIHDFQNPSDPAADDYTVDNKAVIRVVGDTVIVTGDTLVLYGGITSDAVGKVSLVTEYRWDFDDDGTIDTTISHPDTMRIVSTEEGLLRCRLVCVDRAGLTSTSVVTVRVKKRPVTTTAVYTVVIGRDDTVTVALHPDSSTRVITNAGDTLLLRTTDNSDSLSIVYSTGDSLRMWLDADTISIASVPGDTVPPVIIPPYLPTFPTIPGFPGSLAGECAFFAEDSSLMRTTMNFYDIMWEQTRTDGIEAIEFVEKLLVDIMGYSIITLIGGDYSYTFNKGVYQFTSGDFIISCAFHYGPGVGSHTEDDTVQANLFATSSYVSSPKVTLTPPFYSYTKGPLYELLSGDVSVDGALNVTFKVDFARLKVSFFRRTLHQGASLPLYVVNDSLHLKMEQESFAKMAPVRVLQFSDRFHNDSILIDHSGSSLSSAPADLKVTYRSGEKYQTATYAFTAAQRVDEQKTAYGDRNGTLKLSGDYAATATLGFDGHEQSVFFKGRYSSTVSDSSWFYCDDGFTDEFGTLFFGEISDTVGVFSSGKFGYTFPYTPMRKLLSW